PFLVKKSRPIWMIAVYGSGSPRDVPFRRIQIGIQTIPIETLPSCPCGPSQNLAGCIPIVTTSGRPTAPFIWHYVAYFGYTEKAWIPVRGSRNFSQWSHL